MVAGFPIAMMVATARVLAARMLRQPGGARPGTP